MKKFLALFVMAAVLFVDVQAQTEFQIITVVESIVPSGLGRSRLIQQKQEVNADDFTTERTDGRSSNQGEVRRKDVKIETFEETKLLNFFNLGGINFQNIASNDAVISDKLNKMAAEGWTLAFVTSGVESVGGGDDANGIFITRFVFKR